MQMIGKSTIVLGGSRGIGRAAAKLFAREGASVTIGARRADALDDLVQEIEAAGGHATALAGDMTDEAYAKALVEKAVGTFGGLDVAFNTAGMLGTLGEAVTLTRDDWEQTLTTNLTGSFLAAKHQLPALEAQGGGSLVFTGSFVGYTVGMPGMAAYAASKAALVGLSQVLAAEYGPRGVRVNALLPGGTDTEMADEFIDSPETLEFVKGLHGLKRLATPEEIAQAALFLCSDSSAFMTGAAMLADGGVSINRT